MFKKILIAGRGEIALRIIRACRELGVQTVAIYSEADAASLPVRYADESVCVGPADSALSYLNVARIISAAEITHAEAIHPGYGFLAEQSHFAEICKSSEIKFIGPSSKSMELIGNKINARHLMQELNIPTVPGSDGEVDEKRALDVAEEIGYPVVIKAAAGGGGKGMRVVYSRDEMERAFRQAKAESGAAFGNDAVYVEKFLAYPRHIEVQILADEEGGVVHIGERDCSIQRRYQKVVEESPAPVFDPTLRKTLAQAALKIVKKSGYVNAGTVEFLVDQSGAFYCIEMNARIQVEHPVSEMVSGIDLIKEQIQIAAGHPLRFTQRQIKLQGCSMECRINAEDPMTFVPSPGMITEFYMPGGPGVRVDSAYTDQSVISPYYDSLIAKLIVHAPTRMEAIMKMRGALAECVVKGVNTTLPLHRQIFEDPDFVRGEYSTHFLERFFPPLP